MKEREKKHVVQRKRCYRAIYKARRLWRWDPRRLFKGRQSHRQRGCPLDLCWSWILGRLGARRLQRRGKTPRLRGKRLGLFGPVPIKYATREFQRLLGVLGIMFQRIPQNETSRRLRDPQAVVQLTLRSVGQRRFQIVPYPYQQRRLPFRTGRIPVDQDLRDPRQRRAVAMFKSRMPALSTLRSSTHQSRLGSLFSRSCAHLAPL